GISPEAHSAVGLGHIDRVVSRRIHPEKGAAQRVFWATPVSGRTEARVAPYTCPGGGILGINCRIGERFFVAHQRSISRLRSINAWFPTSLPEAFVAAEECKIDASCTGSFYVGSLS